MKRLLLSALCAVPAFCMGQTLLYNDGAMIKVQAGATLYVEGGIQNTATGTIDNDGTIEVKGNFINAGTWDPNQPNTLKFTGNVNSDVTSGTAKFQTVIIQKDATFNVNLIDNMTVNTNLNFNAAGASKLNLGAKHLILPSAATVTGYDSDEYIVTGGTGKVKRFYGGAGSFEYPVGFNTTTYNPATINLTAGPNDTLSVRVGDRPTDGNGMTGIPIDSQVVYAVWEVTESTAGGNTANVTFGWAETDESVNFPDLLNAVSKNDGTNGWDALHADRGPEVGNTRTRNGLTSFGAFAVGGKDVSNTLYLNAKVILQGAYVAVDALMVDSLRKYDYIPLTEPYSTLVPPYVHKAYGGGEKVSGLPVFNQPLNADDIVDWIVIELRSLTDSTTVLATKTCLLQRDGDLVDLTGTGAVAIQGVGDANYILGIRHRNHLGIRTAASSALNNTVGALVNMTLIGTIFDDPSIAKPLTPMKLITGTIYGMWSGDATFNGDVSFNGGGNDKNVVLSAVGGSAGSNNVIPGYHRADLNLNSVTSFNGSNNDKNVILANVTSADINTPLSAHNNN